MEDNHDEQTDLEGANINVADDNALLGPTPGQSGSSADALGAEAGLKPLEDSNENPRELGPESAASDDTDETEAEM